MRAAFRLLVASSLATERGRPAWLDEHRLSMKDSLMLLRNPFDVTGMETSLRTNGTLSMPTLPSHTVTAFRREVPMARISVEVDPGLPIDEAWRAAGVELLGILGEDADVIDRLYARTAGLEPPRSRPMDARVDAQELVDVMNGLIAPPQGGWWGMISPTQTTDGLIVRINPVSDEIIAHRPLPPSLAARLDRTMSLEGGRSAAATRRMTTPDGTGAPAIMRAMAGLGADLDVLMDALRP